MMQAGSHMVPNLALAVMTENLVPIACTPLHWPNLILSAQASTVFSSGIVAKGIYYGCMLVAVTLLNIDQRLRIFGKHRTFTHSCLGVLSFVGILLCLRFLVLALLARYSLALTAGEQLFSQTALVVLPLACCFHILADGLTIRGVGLFWPKAVYVRLLQTAVPLPFTTTLMHIAQAVQGEGIS